MSTQNRIKQGLTAAIGTAAITVLTALRVAAARDEEINVKGTALVTTIFSLTVGLVWSLMPRAKDPLSESVDAMKEELAPAMKTAMNVAIIEATEYPATTQPTTKTGQAQYVPAEAGSRYAKGFNKPRSINDDELDDTNGWEKSDYPWET